MMYGSLFVGALKTLGVLCLGLYRVMDSKAQKRYVITNPSRDFHLLPSDKVTPPAYQLPYQRRNAARSKGSVRLGKQIGAHFRMSQT